MTTLGALLVGLLLLLLLLGVLAWMQLRPRRGPEQPRTVADLVRMREAVRPDADDSDDSEVDAPAESAEIADREPDPVEAPEAPVAVAEPARVDEAPDRVSERPDEREVRRARVPVSPEDAAVEAPWARAARMVEPWRESDASDEPRPVADVAPVAAPRRPSLALVPSGDGDARPRSARRTRQASVQRSSTPVVADPATAERPVSSQVPSNGVADRRAASAMSTFAPTHASATPADSAAAPADPSAVQASAPVASAVDADVPTPPAAAPTAGAESPSAAPAHAPAADAAPAHAAAAAAAAAAALTNASATSAHAPAEKVAAPAGPTDAAAAALTVEAAKPAAPIAAPIAAPTDVSPTAVGDTVESDKSAIPARAPAGAAVKATDAAVVFDRTSARGADVPDVAAEPRSENAHLPAIVADDVAAPPAAHGRPDVAAPDDDAPIAPADAGFEVVDRPVAVSSVVLGESSASTGPAMENRAASANGTATDNAGATNGHGPTPTHARVAGRVRRRPSATPAEQAAADLALLRTFGVTHRNSAEEPDVELEGCAPDDDAPPAGNAQPISFRVLGRDGRGIRGATVTLLDDHGREAANTRTNADGQCLLTARHPGGYMLVTAAEGYQPGAITVAVTDEPVDAEIPLTRSATIAGSVGGEDGPIVGAQLALVQDGEIVDATESTAEGAYRFADLAAGEYGLTVTAHECEAAAFVLELADEADLRQDVELVPGGLPSDDVVTAPR